MNLNQLRDELHALAREKGWYDQPETDTQFIARFRGGHRTSRDAEARAQQGPGLPAWK